MEEQSCEGACSGPITKMVRGRVFFRPTNPLIWHTGGSGSGMAGDVCHLRRLPRPVTCLCQMARREWRDSIEGLRRQNRTHIRVRSFV